MTTLSADEAATQRATSSRSDRKSYLDLEEPISRPSLHGRDRLRCSL